jgi:hypothetical protein
MLGTGCGLQAVSKLEAGELILKKTERSDIHKSSIFNLQSSIFNLQFSIPARPS